MRQETTTTKANFITIAIIKLLAMSSILNRLGIAVCVVLCSLAVLGKTRAAALTLPVLHRVKGDPGLSPCHYVGQVVEAQQREAALHSATGSLQEGMDDREDQTPRRRRRRRK